MELKDKLQIILGVGAVTAICVGHVPCAVIMGGLAVASENLKGWIDWWYSEPEKKEEKQADSTEPEREAKQEADQKEAEVAE